jgi:iron transport multicopper oxidase
VAYRFTRAGFNNITWIPQVVPSLYTALSAPKDLVGDKRIYGHQVNPHIVNEGDIVEIVVNNFDDGPHPLHLHGHAMQLVARSSGVYTPRKPGSFRHPNHNSPSGQSPDTVSNSTFGFTPGQDVQPNMPKFPMRRDTWTVAGSGYTVWRYKATNPGVWILHVSSVPPPDRISIH